VDGTDDRSIEPRVLAPLGLAVTTMEVDRNLVT